MGMARLTLKVSPSTCFRNPNRLPFRLRLQPALLQAGYDSRAKDSGLTSGEVRRGQFPSRRAATLNKSQSQPAVATTITIDNTVRLKRLRMRYCPRSEDANTSISVLCTLLKHLSFVDIPQAGR